MKILILGGTGSMGASLVRKLSVEDNKIFVTSRSPHESKGNVIYLKGNALDDDFLKSIKEKYDIFDAIIDFMHYSTQEFEKRYIFLLGMTKQYVFLSSARVYNDSPCILTEESPLLIDTINNRHYLDKDGYPIAKARCERILQKSESDNWTIIRPYITFDTYRLQLGIYEKETWLRRIVSNRPLLLTNDILKIETTLTFSDDLVDRLKALIGNPKANGEVFQIASNETIHWKTVFDIYCKVLQDRGYRPIIHYLPSSSSLKSAINLDQLYYDRLVKRAFNSTKIEKVTGIKEWTPITEGLSMCLNKFLDDPKYRVLPSKLEGYMDRLLHGNSYSEIKGSKEKIKYLAGRYTPYISLRYMLEREIFK